MTGSRPETRFAFVGDDRIVYQVYGNGPPDLVFSTGVMGNVDDRWDNPVHATSMLRLGEFSRVIIFDSRGSGGSDPLPPGTVHGWEAWVDDVKAVMSAVGSERAAIVGFWDAGATALLFAATEPEKVLALVLVGSTARYLEAPDYPFGLAPEAKDGLVQGIRQIFGTEDFAVLSYPSQANNRQFLEWYARYQRGSASAAHFAEHLRQMFDLDIRSALPLVHVPTLVVTTENDVFSAEHARYLAEHIDGARLLVLPTKDMTPMVEYAEEFAGAIEELLTGTRRQIAPTRKLATVLFTDIVGSTERAAEIGDTRWRQILDAHDDLVQQAADRFGGRVVNTTGDGALVSFEGPARAITCCMALRDALRAMGLEIRSGLHAGEVETRGENIGGLAVHIAARVMAEAAPGELLASSTVKDLVIGSGITFADRGTRSLKGVPDEWRLYAVESV